MPATALVGTGDLALKKLKCFFRLMEKDREELAPEDGAPLALAAAADTGRGEDRWSRDVKSA
jgi:hypothetical protein